MIRKFDQLHLAPSKKKTKWLLLFLFKKKVFFSLMVVTNGHPGNPLDGPSSRLALRGITNGGDRGWFDLLLGSIISFTLLFQKININYCDLGVRSIDNYHWWPYKHPCCNQCPRTNPAMACGRAIRKKIMKRGEEYLFSSKKTRQFYGEKRLHLPMGWIEAAAINSAPVCAPLFTWAVHTYSLHPRGNGKLWSKKEGQQ